MLPTSLFIDLLPLMLGAALAPLWPVIWLLILQSRRGLVKATAFVTGITLVRLLKLANLPGTLWSDFTRLSAPLKSQP